MKPLILIPQSNTTTTMIYAETIYYIRCDRCGKAVLKTASFEVVRKTAERKGWLITDKGDWLKERHYCQKCKELLTNATKEES